MSTVRTGSAPALRTISTETQVASTSAAKKAAPPPPPPRADTFTTPATVAAPPVVTAPVNLLDASSPSLMKSHGAAPAAVFTLDHVAGPLFVNGKPSPNDVHQGEAGDCYLLSTLASIANTTPDVIKNMIRPNDDGSFTVTFKDAMGTDVQVHIDDKLYSKHFFRDGTEDTFAFSAIYATSNDRIQVGPDSAKRTEAAMWVPLIEKAYAKLHGGSYEAIGFGGYPSAVMKEVLGGKTSTFNISDVTADDSWARIKKSVDAKVAICASTKTDSASASLYTNTGLVHGHAYSVLGASEHDGAKYVTLRNPWGSTEPGNDGKDDGVFEMKLDDFVKYYQTIDSVKVP